MISAVLFHRESLTNQINVIEVLLLVMYIFIGYMYYLYILGPPVFLNNENLMNENNLQVQVE